MRKLFLSKWLYYGTIAVALLILFIYFLPLAWEGNDIAANFLSEIWGLFFTLAIFLMIFDFREWLEWKKVEDRVKDRIQRQILGIFVELSTFCVRDIEEKKGEDLAATQLDVLASREVKITSEAKKDLLRDEIRRCWEWILDSRRRELGQIEDKYFRFLDSEIQASFMDIEDYLRSLCILLMGKHKEEREFFERFSFLTGKIMKEIRKLKGRGIWLNV